MKRAWLIRRLAFALQSFPKRGWRLLTYYFHPFYSKPKFRALPLMLAECFFFFDVYEILTNIFKKEVRLLTPDEILRGREVFGDSIDLSLVMIDNKAQMMTQSKGIIYVSFNTINSWGHLREDIFIHELVHVWQYQHHGAGYIMKALVAQQTAAGYNYTHENEDWHLLDSIYAFNGEQQADLVQDFYRIKKGLKPDWGNYTQNDLPKYEKFIAEINLSHI